MFAATSQIFDITLEGTKVESAFNVTDASGGCVANGGAGSHPVSKTYTIAVTDGTLDVELTSTAANQASMLSALQVITH